MLQAAPRLVPVYGLAVGAVILAAMVPLAGYLFPSGGDIAHMLAAGRGVGAEIHQPPLVPTFLAVVYRLVGHDISALFWILKVIAVASLLATGWGLARLTRGLTTNPSAPGLAFFLAVANPMALYQVLWGSPGPFVAAGFAVAALAMLFEWETGSRARFWAVAFSVLTLATHWYTAMFLAGAGLVVLGFQRPWRPELHRSVATWGAVGFALALPVVPTYARVARDLRLDSGTRALFSLEYFPGFGSIMYKRLAVTMACAALVLFAAWLWRRHAWPADANSRRAAVYALAWAAGFLVLLAGTPANLAGRAYYFLPLVVIPMLAVLIHGHGRRPLRGVRAGAVASGLVVLLVATSLHAYGDDASYFNPLGRDSLDAFQLLAGRDPGAVAVYSPFPNIDAWWLEALAARPGRPTDLARYYALRQEVEWMDLAKRAASGEYTVDYGGAVFSTSPERALPVPASLLRRHEGDIFPLLQILEGESTLQRTDGDDTLLRPPQTAASPRRNGETWEETWSIDGEPIRRSVHIEAGRWVLDYELPQAYDEVDLVLGAGPNATFSASTDDSLRHHWAPGGVESMIHMEPRPFAIRLDVVHVALPAAEGRARLEIQISGSRLDPSTQVDSSGALLDRAGATAVYLRAVPESIARRFLTDPEFSVLQRAGDVLVLERRGGS